MPLTFIKNIRGTPLSLPVHGYMVSDRDALSDYQTASIQRLSVSIQLELEFFLLQHPEVSAMLKIMISKLSRKVHTGNMVDDLALLLTRPAEELDKEIRKYLNLPPDGPYLRDEGQKFDLNEFALFLDLQKIACKFYPPYDICLATPAPGTPLTPSSSFISNVTSASTPLTPEPEPEREPTMEEIFYKMISNTLDKATLLKVTDEDIKYDTAYVELMKAVERAMDIPVIEIRKDIAQLYKAAYKEFEYFVLEKERIAAAIAWEKRMRKKLKRLLRRQKNFKGYETPPSTSELSSHPSYKIPPPRPCECHPQYTFNRYPKDRYGIYLASGKKFDDNTVTVAPAISEDKMKTVDGDIVDATTATTTASSAATSTGHTPRITFNLKKDSAK